MQLTDAFHAEVREALLAVIRILVVDKAEVRVTISLEENTALYEIRVAKSDLRLVIGQQGRTARALRVLISAAGQGRRTQYRLEYYPSIDSKSPSLASHGRSKQTAHALVKGKSAAGL